MDTRFNRQKKRHLTLQISEKIMDSKEMKDCQELE